MFLDGHTATAEDAMLGNTRHKDALYRAKEAMEHCMETITMRMPEDLSLWICRMLTVRWAKSQGIPVTKKL